MSVSVRLMRQVITHKFVSSGPLFFYHCMFDFFYNVPDKTTLLNRAGAHHGLERKRSKYISKINLVCPSSILKPY